MKSICSIYRSLKLDGTYLYVLKSDSLKRVPESLIKAFGNTHHSFDMVLTPERRLSRENITVVLENLKKQGYHLQMPQSED